MQTILYGHTKIVNARMYKTVKGATGVVPPLSKEDGGQKLI